MARIRSEITFFLSIKSFLCLQLIHMCLLYVDDRPTCELGCSPSGVMIKIKNGCCWPLTAAWRGGKGWVNSKVIWAATAGILKEQLSVHKLLEMTFTPDPPRTFGCWCVFVLFCMWEFVCSFLLLYAFLSSLNIIFSFSFILLIHCNCFHLFSWKGERVNHTFPSNKKGKLVENDQLFHYGISQYL